EPFIGTVVLGGGLLRRSNSRVAHDLIGGIAAGDVVTGFAALEPTSGQSFHSVRTTARREGQDWVLDGEKIVVSDAPIATHLIITARTSGDHADTSGLTLFAVPFDPAGPSQGIEAHHYRTIDDHHASDLVMTDLRLPDSARISEVDQAWPVIDAALDEATAATVAEAVGMLRKVLADTVEYTKQPSLNLDGPRRTRAVSAAKATIARAARLVGQEAVQLHGGMGMTEELAIGHYFKRLTAIESEFGNQQSDAWPEQHAAVERQDLLRRQIDEGRRLIPRPLERVYRVPRTDIGLRGGGTEPAAHVLGMQVIER
ncbi:acyl-CoA dehydrogenase family protein, partial [Aduncisulcus paluster]